MSVFHFILLSLATFRITRFITSDELAEPFRHLIAHRFGDNSKITYLVECNWCTGLYITAGMYALDYYVGIPTIILAALATMAIVGFIGNYDD